MTKERRGSLSGAATKSGRTTQQVSSRTATGPQLRLREALRDTTRGVFIEAARELFYKHGYDDVTVDDIAALAGSSRATFYSYFVNKRGVLLNLLDDVRREQYKVYEMLARLPNLSVVSLRAWLVEFRREMEEHQQSLRLFTISGGGVIGQSPTSVEHRDRIIQLLGERFAAFDLIACEAELYPRKRASAYMMLFVIEQVATVFSVAENSPDINVGQDILAEQLFNFLRQGAKGKAI